LPMFELAARACAPANADLSVRTAGVEVLERPQQAGLALATYLLLGHRSGGCPACRLPRLSPGARLLLGVLSAQDAGKWGKLKQALLLGARVGAPTVLAGLDLRV